MVSAAVSGFVVGVVVTLAALGVFAHSSSQGAPPATIPPATPRPRVAIKAAVENLATKVLGPSYPDPSKKRLLAVHLIAVDPDLPLHVSTPATRLLQNYVSLVIEFRLNDHPLGPTWRARLARADVFQVMKALYTSRLPIYNVEMVGMYPLKSGKKTRVQQALVAYLSHTTAATLPWKRFKRTDEGKLWSLLTYRYVNPRFGSLP